MCNHAYTADHFKSHRRMGNRCPYPEFYEKAQSTASSVPEAVPAPALLIDDWGACIFHSQEIAWKRKNDFKGKFLQLVQLLDADGAGRDYDFAEFVFVGSEIRTKSGSEEHVLHIADTTFRKQAYFTGASFLDSFELEGVDFQDGADFVYATFAHDLRIENARFRGITFNHATLANLAVFTKVQFLNYALFAKARFTGTESDYTVKFKDSRFEGITDFSGAIFTLGDESTVGFLNIQFEDFTDFKGTKFNCQVEFSDVIFAFTTEFIDTSFNMGLSSARYRGSAIEFNQITVTSKAVLTFMSTDSQNKMFNHDVQMSFKEDPAGTIRFENVNFNRISTESKDRLTHLAKLGRVEIGSGCIKYRFQTGTRTISVSQGNAPLILELCQTFTNYFTASSGLNLGFEIVERDKTKVSFFYFTDEDISEVAFFERLAQTEESLWNLLSVRPDEKLLALEGPTGATLSTGKESSLINAVDGLSALLGTFFRVGVRIALGVWQKNDTKALLGAIRFNNEGAENRALSLHQVFVDKYTGRTLFRFNRQQNEILPPMVVKGRNMLNPGKVRILFLAANSVFWPLDLDKEVNKIQTSLKLAKERDNLEIKQEWVVTVETLMQAMLDESPTIVHFSGHGDESGIILQDDMGKPKVASPDALSSLFNLFKDTVRCVVLSSCYSESQARAIRRHIPYVIGAQFSIPDSTAVAFSTGFYKALGAGKDIPFAFNMGKMSIQLEGLSGENSLVLL
jgi:uncharacterized protein YjbI with pentapeptide repeats